jgi:hypothetical protein
MFQKLKKLKMFQIKIMKNKKIVKRKLENLYLKNYFFPGGMDGGGTSSCLMACI